MLAITWAQLETHSGPTFLFFFPGMDNCPISSFLLFLKIPWMEFFPEVRRLGTAIGAHRRDGGPAFCLFFFAIDWDGEDG